MIKKTGCLVFIALLLAMTACTSAAVSSVQPGENHPLPTASDPSKTIFFPRQEKTNGERAVMEALIHGILVFFDNCVRVDSDFAHTSYLLIWPPDFNVTIENGKINILNGNGEIVAHIGDRVRISGGEVPSLAMLDKSTQEQMLRQCAGPYWIMGDEIATEKQSPINTPSPSETPTEAVWSVQKMPTPLPPPTCCPPTYTPRSIMAGIFEASLGPDMDQAYAISTVWQDIVNGQPTRVYAGARIIRTGTIPTVTPQGIVLVTVHSSDYSNNSMVAYDAPGATGALKITEANGYRLTLVGQNGKTVYFDVLTRQFVNGLAVTLTAPTITPLPSQTPTATARPGYPPPETPTPYPAS